MGKNNNIFIIRKIFKILIYLFPINIKKILNNIIYLGILNKGLFNIPNNIFRNYLSWFFEWSIYIYIDVFGNSRKYV